MQINVADIMTRQTITTRPQSTVAEVAKLLVAHDISTAPVCDDDGSLLGIISEGDLMRPFCEEHALHRAWWLGVLAVGSRLSRRLDDYITTDRRCARDLMTSPVVTAGETATFSEIATLLLRHRIKRVPIVQNGRLVGIVSREDLVRAMAQSPDSQSSADWKPTCVGSDRPSVN